MDGFELLARAEDGDGVAVYVDSPYIEKKIKYKHDFAPADHARLAGLLDRFTKTRVVVSYYAHPELDRLYPAPAWVRVDKTTKKKMTNGRATAPEVLLIKN
jgi:site-specific DNA-adenine methylase